MSSFPSLDTTEILNIKDKKWKILATFRGSGWEYMVQIDGPITSECWEGVPSPGGQ